MNQVRRHYGFTLIELLVVVSIVGILLAVAIPSYREQVLRTRRADAQAQLQSIAQSLERYNTLNSTYVGFTGCSPASDFYTMSCTTLTRTAFVVAAAPSGEQTADRCKTLTLSSTGQQGVTGGATASAADCW